MEEYITISSLNDFIFCPYSIYLHNVYMETDETIFHAAPQTRGKIAHETIEKKTSSNRKDDLISLPVYSTRFKLMGKIDIFRRKEKLLIERKYQLKQIYQGQLYQLWAQYFCLQEMGYEVEHLAFYEISTNKMIPVALPNEIDIFKFNAFIENYLQFNPADKIPTNINKCKHCIYCNLCDKTESENVYQ